MKKYSKSFEYSSVLIIVVGFLILGWIFNQPNLFKLSVGVGLLSLLSGWIRKWITIGWMGLGHALGWVNSRIILGAIFYLVLFPLSLFQSGKTKRKFKPNKTARTDSNFVERNYRFKKTDFDQMW